MINLKNLATKTSPLLDFIDSKWEDLTGNARDGHNDTVSSWESLANSSIDGHLDDINHDHPYILFLPNNYIFPGGRFVVQFYWDSYFIILSLLRGSRFQLAKGMVENCLYLVDKHGMVIANRKRWAAGSQLPFLSEMVREVHEIQQDMTWLQKAVILLEKEYHNYWLNQNHLVSCGLSRYCVPTYFPQEFLAEITLDNESTWDMSPRFDREDILDLLPVDLNSNLFMYERNLATFYKYLGQIDISELWQERSQKRKDIINELMWDEEDGIYYDYNYKLGKRKKIKSLATYFPLFYKLSNQTQAERIKDNLALFEKEAGLATCDHDYGYDDRQWNYPIGWAPLHLIVYKGLKNYGFTDDAERIAIKWLNLNYNTWKKTNKLFEKYDVVSGTNETLEDKRYRSNQEGFGWTNAVFHILVLDLLASN